ncbi:ribosomal L28e protein family-domain-containing protein [Lasiosphaeria miniovina]|uniref:Protein MAK16 n=1 Tax=Lasiosphaeria miniovina TaxID=1954250 RepID=A0AA40B4D4_9PEZI|nr:ribosomal L28e protein family-domain-containing protein [Lasiosphaeria miniovina]KAK0727262.1 ribosomal L28e protein family-domain-containing protein [Lasiosphaeria miniovina]
MSDEIVWQIINQQFCAFKLKTTKGQNFCRNEYNVSGLCNRQSCPLANSRYASVRTSPKGTIYLYIKTIERAHMPSKWWEKIKLSANYQDALKQIEERLQYFPKFLLHKCKQRLTRLVQVATRMRKIAAEETRLGEKLVPKMAPKIKHREAARERKALMAAKLERTIERELLERLRQGAYGDQPLNVNANIWKKVLNALETEGEGTRDKDLDKGIEDDDEEADSEEELEEDELDGAVEYVSDFDESDEELADIEDWLGSDDGDDADDDDDDDDSADDSTDKKKKAGDKRKRGRVVKMEGRKKREMEVEKETERSKLLAF